MDSSFVFDRHEIEALDDLVVNCRLNAADLVIVRVGMRSIRIGEQHDEKASLFVDPDGGAGKSGVTDALFRKIAPAGRRLGGHIPAERARVLRERVW